MFGGVTKRKKTSISTHKKRRTNNNIPKPTQRQSNKQIIKLSSIKIGQPTQQQQPPTLTNKRSSSRAHKLQDSIVNNTSSKLTRTVLPPNEPDIKFLEVVNGEPKCMHITIESTGLWHILWSQPRRMQWCGSKWVSRNKKRSRLNFSSASSNHQSEQ